MERVLPVHEVDVVPVRDAHAGNGGLVAEHIAHLVCRERLVHVEVPRVHAAEQRCDVVGAPKRHDVAQALDERVARRGEFVHGRVVAQTLVTQRQPDDEQCGREVRHVGGRVVRRRLVRQRVAQTGERLVEVLVCGGESVVIVVVGGRARV